MSRVRSPSPAPSFPRRLHVAPFKEWETFYVIMGSSAAALIGLQFVVITLVADIERSATTREIDAFATPTIVHFGSVLAIAGIVCSPWHRNAPPAIVLAIFGVGGLLYSMLVLKRAHAEMTYTPVVEDWVFHVVLPIVAYAAVSTSGFILRAHPEEALFTLGTAALVLLFVAIHNAWDTVTYIVVVRRNEPSAPPPSSTKPSS